MKTVSISLLALLSTFSMTGAANAQNFDGPSIGAQAGWVENKVSNPATDLGVVAVDASQDSAVLGGYAVYDKEFGKFVLGAEIGANFGTSDTVSSGTVSSGTVSSGTGLNRAMLDPKRSFDLSARAGYLVTPSTLLYARGGYTNDRVSTTAVSATGTRSTSEDRDGWLLGGGLERMLTDRISARLEYRYADLSNGDGAFDRRQVLTGITYHF